MGHKAKPKSKPSQPAKSTEKSKTTSQVTPAEKAKKTLKIETIQKSTTTQEKTKDRTSSSCKKPVTRDLGERGVESGQVTETGPSQNKNTNTNTSFFVFHKREHKRDGTDISGLRGLRAWKESSGRNKSWANCRRHKLAHNDLEHRLRSKLPPNAFGWEFSTTLMPLSFVRGHGMLVTKQSRAETKRVSNGRHFQDLESEHSPEWPLPKGFPLKNRKQPVRESKFRGGVSFLRLVVGREKVGIIAETFPEKISLSTTVLRPLDQKGKSRVTKFEDLVVIDLLRNESHADVYLVQDLNHPSKFYYVHAFLNQNHGLTGNWSTFSKRKMDRLRKSNGFHAESIQSGRKIVLMEADSKENVDFHIKNMQQDFPPLPNSERKSAKIRPPKFRKSYASVVTPKQPIKHPVDSNHRAHKAWEDRKGRGKEIADTNFSKPEPIQVTELSQPEKVWTLVPVVNGRKFRNIPLRNRFSILSRVIL